MLTIVGSSRVLFSGTTGGPASGERWRRNLDLMLLPSSLLSSSSDSRKIDIEGVHFILLCTTKPLPSLFLPGMQEGRSGKQSRNQSLQSILFTLQPHLPLLKYLNVLDGLSKDTVFAALPPSTFSRSSTISVESSSFLILAFGPCSSSAHRSILTLEGQELPCARTRLRR